MHWDDYGIGMAVLHKHVVTAFDPVQSKSQFLKSPNSFFPLYGRVGGHQRMPTARLSSASLGAVSGIFFRFASIDLM